MKGANTRERLLGVALEQFGERGYGGTSIRDLAGAVGVRESSVYKHFASKQALWEALLARTTQDFDRESALLRDSLAQFPGEASLVRLEFLAETVLAFFRENPAAKALRRLLVVAQNQDPRVGQLLRDRCANFPLGLLTDALRQAGIDEAEAELWGLQLWGPIYLLIDVAADDEQRAHLLLHRHVVNLHARLAA